MAYRRPGVTVTQEFAAAAPAIAALSLPNVAVGPAYHLVDNDALGTYSGAEQAYAYASQMPGSITDIAELAAGELFPATKKPISVYMQNTVVEVLPLATTGAGAGTAFSDATLDQFADVAVGDTVVITEHLNVAVIAPQTNGVSSDTAGIRDRLAAGTLNQFANVKAGDTVEVTGGTNTNIGTFTVLVKISSNTLKLNAEVNDGVGISANVAFSITGNRGTTNAGSYRVKEKLDNNNLTLESPLVEVEAPLDYMIKRKLAGNVVVPRSTLGFSADTAAITVISGFTVNGFPVIAGNVFASYRSFRTDLASEVRSFGLISDIEAVFGVGQLVPANPLAYVLYIAKQNTASAVSGLGLSADYITDETLAFTKSLDVLAMTDMYACMPLSQLPTVHMAFKNHVVQLSEPDSKLERVVIFNSLLNTIGLVSDETVTSSAIIGARSIVPTQVDGAGVIASPSVLNDATADQFLNVRVGDSVVIASGTGVTPGTYTVASKQSSNQITLSANFITSGSPADITYYAVRKDGLGADGKTFYDRNATFITDGAASGHFLEILVGTYAGRFKIGSVTSEKELVLASAIAGVLTLQTAVDYKVTRDLSKDEQASNVAGYSHSFGSRRVCHTWPDIVKAPIGSTLVNLPGYCSAESVAALTTGLPSQQGFTNLSIGGFLGLEHSSKYFTEAQLNVIADGGTLIFVQEGPDQPLLIRHQLTTDRTSIKFQEYSVTKNCDFMAKVIRSNYEAAIGKYNIVDTTMDYLKTVAQGLISFFKDGTKRPFIGGNIRSGSLAKMEESPTQIDTVLIRFAFQIPIPLNYIDIVMEV